MLRLIALIVGAFALATGLAWLAERPGTLVLDWQGYEVETSVFRAVVILTILVGASVFLWNLMRQIWLSPAVIGTVFNRRRQKRGLEALSTGLIALGAGDKVQAMRYAVQARRTLPNEPLTHLLRAQAARLAGDSTTSRRIFEAMLSSPDTEQLGLRGLFLEAEAEGESEAARQFAERAMRVNPKLSWAVESVFDLQCKHKDWQAALDTLGTARKHGHIDKVTAERRRAVLLTAQAQPLEDSDPERALALATEAQRLADDLVPAAAIAGRILASKGNTPRATKLIQQTWKRSPNPDLAVAHAYARIGDSPRDRLQRVKQLAMSTPMSIESPIAVATAAIEAKDWDEARAALEPLVEGRLTQRVCTLMARIEGEQHGDKGRVREWLARAVNAPRDPAWTADGVVSDSWAPVSPVTGRLDAFEWKVPVTPVEKRDAGLLAQKLEELVALGAPRADREADETKVLEARPLSSVEAEAVPVRVRPRSVLPDADVVDVPDEPVTRRDATAAPADREATSREVATRLPAPVEREAAPMPGPVPPRPRPQPVENAPAPLTGPPAKPVVNGPTDSPVAAAARAAASGIAEVAVAADDKQDATVTSRSAAGTMRREANASSASNVQRLRKPGEPRIFVPPRAPDDPGTKEDERRSPLSQFRPPN